MTPKLETDPQVMRAIKPVPAGPKPFPVTESELMQGLKADNVEDSTPGILARLTRLEAIVADRAWQQLLR